MTIEDDALRYLIDRHGLDEDEAREILTDLDDEDPCQCPDCHEQLLALLRDHLGPPMTTLVPRAEYL